MNPRPIAVVVLLLASATALSTALSSQAGPPPSVTLLSRDGRRALPIVLLADQEMVGLDDLAAAFQLTVREEALGAITVSYKGKTIVLTPDQALASVSGRLVSLPAPPARNGARWVVPIEFVRAVALIYDARLELRKPSRLLIVGELRVPRLTIRFDSLGASGRLTIDATPRALSTVTQDGDHLTLKFEADALDVPNPPLPAQTQQTLLQGVRIVDPTTLAIDLGPRVAGFKATSQPVDTTMRLVIDLLGQTDTTPAPPPPGAPPPPPAAAELPSPFGQPSSAMHTIALDPGHGGDDEGVRGGQGAKEKDLTIAVARRAKAVIEARLGLRVLLTRDDDRKIPIDERPAIANNNKADLFISLHANGSMRKATMGASVFCAAFDKDTSDASAAGPPDRVPTFGGGARDIELVMWDVAQTRHLTRSAVFADLLQQQLRDRVPLSSMPNERAALRVLESANMPAVLVEMGYLTNPDQEKLLTSDAFQGAVVQAIVDAIVRFRDLPAAGVSR